MILHSLRERAEDHTDGGELAADAGVDEATATCIFADDSISVKLARDHGDAVRRDAPVQRQGIATLR